MLDCTPVCPWYSSDSHWALQVGQHICNTTAVMGRCKVSGAHASPWAGHAVALKAKLNPRHQLWQGICWLQGRYWAGCLVLGRWRGDVEGINQLQFSEHRGTCSVPCHLGVCSVSPIAHNMLLCSWLTFWGWISLRLLPKESEGLWCLLGLPCRMTETSAFSSARDV